MDAKRCVSGIQSVEARARTAAAAAAAAEAKRKHVSTLDKFLNVAKGRKKPKGEKKEKKDKDGQA